MIKVVVMVGWAIEACWRIIIPLSLWGELPVDGPEDSYSFCVASLRIRTLLYLTFCWAYIRRRPVSTT